MTGSLTVSAGLDLPHPDDHPLDRLIAGHVKRHAGVAPAAAPALHGLIEDRFFALDNVAAFAAASEETQTAIRARCALNVMEEAYFIEKSGLAYGARMLLLAENAAERQCFALMSGDEATHLAWITPFVPEESRRRADHPFLKLIAELIENAPAPVLVYVLQAILEGWGLAHYRALANAARNETLAHILQAILKDEAMHVGLGERLLDPAKFSHAERALTLDAMAAFLTMVRVGPLGVAAVLQMAGMTPADAHQALDGEGDAARKLELLRTLMNKEGMGWAAETLAGQGLFMPMPAKDAVRLLS